MTAEGRDESQLPHPLVAEGLGKTFQDQRLFGRSRRTCALQDATLTLERGEAFGLIGPNGAGKSTAIKLFTGLIFPTQGRVLLNGLPPSRPHSRRGLGVVPENPSLYLHLSPRETIYSAARLHRLPPREAQARTEELLGQLGLTDVKDTLIRQFSKGMAQRVALGQALAGRPHLLILDEPLTGLDPVWRRRVVDLLAEFRSTGGTLLFSSHILADVERLADRIGIILEGRLQEVTTTSELLAEALDRYTLRFAGPEAGVPNDAIEEVPGHWRVEASAPQVWESLDRIRDNGGTLLEVHPRKAGLEDILMARIAAMEGNGAASSTTDSTTS